MAKILHISPLGWDRMRSHWWQIVLISVLFGSVAVGCLYLIFSTVVRISEYWNPKTKPEAISKNVSRKLSKLSNNALVLTNAALPKQKPSSFGVYLGGFTVPVPEHQRRLLDQWDLIILDPFQSHVPEAMSNATTQAVGRVDLSAVVPQLASTCDAIDILENILTTYFRGTVFTGILFANWDSCFTATTQKRLCEAVNKTGLSVYLEVAPPLFLQDRSVLNTESVSGLVIQNASIMPNGEKRDYFQMSGLQSTIKALVTESCMRDFLVMTWEIVDDHHSVSNAVARRSMQWCKFYNMLTWIGPVSALQDAVLNTGVLAPLSAFGWLKEARVMQAHDIWRSNFQIEKKTAADTKWITLLSLFPTLVDLLASSEAQPVAAEKLTTRLSDPPLWLVQTKLQDKPLSVSASGTEFMGLGCFPLGTEPTPAAFTETLQSQLRLRDLDLLHPVPTAKIRSIGMLFKQFHENILLPGEVSSTQLAAAVKELSNIAENNMLHVNLGLDSGFREGPDIRFWAVFQMSSEGVEIFASKNAKGLAGIILHTFLSAKGFSRHTSFEVETAFASWSGDFADNTGLPRRLVQDIELLSPEELLLLLRHLSRMDAMDRLSETIFAHIRKQLIDAPSLTLVKELSTVSYLENSVSADALVYARINWYREQGCCQFPSESKSRALFEEVDTVFTGILREGRENDLAHISSALHQIVQKDHIDAFVDIFVLSLFCAARRAAFEEIYMEVTDRNPMFSNHPDQAAAFAESFALGSRCEAYFDMSPNTFGKLLTDRFRSHYSDEKLPDWTNGAPELATAYTGAQIDVIPGDKVKLMRGYQRFTFLSVFAFPALFDILLLSIVGRGLYLSAFMTYEEQSSATTALMISLLLSGGVGALIVCGGPYYLISMAFAAANMFVLTRLFAGIALTAAGGLIGFVAVSSAKGPRAGIVFYLYLIALTIYFSTLACLASFSYPGYSFLSGRKVILYSIPILFVSPIVTTFTGYDSVIYLAVIYSFIGILLLGLRRITAKWATWFNTLRRTDDAEIREWYISTYCGNGEKELQSLSDPAAMVLSREALLKDILLERKKKLFARQTSDKFVLELSRDWDATNFLLEWYCRYSDTARPIPFSSSWNIQTKVALDTLQSAQKGLRLHNAFIHWRQSSREAGCGVLYFIVALMDKWIDLLTGNHLIGLSAGRTNPYRLSVGFGLVYYLIGAVLIDSKALELHQLIGAQSLAEVRTAKDIRILQKSDARFRRVAYWKILLKFLMWHVWSLAVSASLVWIFQSSSQAVAMFFAYVLSYTGLLWHQYTKIFSGPQALVPLLSGVLVGLPVGITLKACLPSFSYASTVGLGSATWTVAILSMWKAKISTPKMTNPPAKLEKRFHAHTKPWSNPEWSQQELQTFYENLSHMSHEARIKLNPKTHPGTEVKAILSLIEVGPGIREAFPNSEDIVSSAIDAWERKQVSIELVPPGALGPEIRALSCTTASHLLLSVCLERGTYQSVNPSGDYKVIAEALLHAVSEAAFGVSHEYATHIESLVSDGTTETMTRQLREEMNTQAVTRWAERELLRQLCLGFECDIHWEKLSKGIRLMLVNRCLGQPCYLSDTQLQQLQNALCKFDTKDLDAHIARCNLAAAATADILSSTSYVTGENTMSEIQETATHIPHAPREQSVLSTLKAPANYLYRATVSSIKFIVIAFLADQEFQRELHYVLNIRPSIIRIPCSLILNLIWLYAKMVQDQCLSLFLFHGRRNAKDLWNEAKGMSVSIKKKRFQIQGSDGAFTAFLHDEFDGGSRAYYYTGIHKSEPRDAKLLKYISTYSTEMQLLAKQEFKDGCLFNEYYYDYQVPARRNSKLSRGSELKAPMGRRCVRGAKRFENVRYNRRGLIEAGSYMKDGNLVRFKYHYRKSPQFEDELLRAEFVLPHISCTVSWCAPPLRHPEKFERWIPHSKVMEATFVQGADVYESHWLYDHKFHPTICTMLNGQKIQTPPLIENDYLGVLSKPKNTSFVHDNPLFYCGSLNSNILTRALGLTSKRFPVSTSHARSTIWKAWKDRVDLDGVIVRWMDDQLLRREKTLAPYWRSRDRGNLSSAKKCLDLHADAIMASADLDDDISGWTPLAVKISDLFNFGPGGDAVVYTRSKHLNSDTDKILHVMAADTGTWPNEGGGVSACRRDMINSLQTIRWHMICESATDFGIPKHQTERNILSLKVIPLWGLDFLTPTHGLFSNKLDSAVDDVTSASEHDIRTNFVPILAALVKSARAIHLSKADISQATRALVNLNMYFQDSRHWTQVWSSDIVKESWRYLWLTQETPNTIPPSEWARTELPTLGTLDVALELWLRYLFIFSIPIPEKIPAVFQASHHSVSASYGVVCKIKRQCTLQIWDHAISWRETNLCLSSALCKLSPFVRNALLGLMRMTSVLTLHHADIILPCADFFNPGWEVEIGTCQGTIEHRNVFRRKVDPIVNGITDMQKFAPVKEIKSKRPTVTMLSHVWYAKDIKTALLAADIIINQWKFDDYHLDIYGALDKAPTYSTECQEIIASKGLRGRVTLRGTADPLKVLENTWLFLNSSLSEGLPLALGEAALTGAPVVCTDVGASLRVLSDPDDFSRFSAVVAPNDALALARAQISMLALLGEWSKYTNDTDSVPALPACPTPEDVAWITRRMYEKSHLRRSLGMMTRKIVQKSFSGERYLREHEQMLWVGKSAKRIMAQAGSDAARRADIAPAIEQIAYTKDEATTITGRTASPWYYPSASGGSTFYDSFSNLQPGSSSNSSSSMSNGGRRNRSSSVRSNNAFMRMKGLPRRPHSAFLPVFTPRHVAPLDPSSESLSLAEGYYSRLFMESASSQSRPFLATSQDQLQHRRQGTASRYRSSDISSIMRDEYLKSSTYWGMSG